MVKATVKKVASGTLRMARGTATAMGLAMMLALTVGAASTALGASGGNFILGQNNVANALTRLTGNVNGSTLQVANTNPGADDTALTLSVPEGETPMRVSSDARVANLNADELDNRSAGDFLPSRTYIVFTQVTGPGGGGTERQGASCDFGDLVLSGGGGTRQNDGRDDDLLRSEPDEEFSWTTTVRDNGAPSTVFGEAVCADFPPLRQ